jgi:hypothetical protein
VTKLMRYRDKTGEIPWQIWWDTVTKLVNYHDNTDRSDNW